MLDIKQRQGHKNIQINISVSQQRILGSRTIPCESKCLSQMENNNYEDPKDLKLDEIDSASKFLVLPCGPDWSGDVWGMDVQLRTQSQNLQATGHFVLTALSHSHIPP